MPQKLHAVRAATAAGARHATGRAPSALYPLDLAYARAGLSRPRADVVRAADLPLPYRSLLEHQRDMTMTLEQHFGGRIALRMLSTFRHRTSYFRRVLLVQEYSGRPVEMGAIRIRLTAFRPAIQARVVRGDVPLGRVLRDGGVDYVSRPTVFLAVTPNSEMMGVFWMREALTLYGRQTEILLAGKKIGDIVEILPRT
jgi:hypothetical protein